MNTRVMKTVIGGLVAVAMAFAMSGTVRAGADNAAQVCSVGTLKGLYIWTFDGYADLGDGQVRVLQKVLCSFDAAAGEIADRGDAVGGVERADQVEARHSGDGGEGVERDRVGVVTVEVVPHPADREHVASLSWER